MSLIFFPPVDDNLVSTELSPVKGVNSVLTNKAYLLFLLLFVLSLSQPSIAESTIDFPNQQAGAENIVRQVKVGVLSHRGDEFTLESWAPTVNYLTNAIDGYLFTITPLGFDEVEPAVEQGQVDFILVNSGIYVNLEVWHRVSRIATLNNLVGDAANNLFGGVIFTRSERDDINSLSELKGKSFISVDEASLGGFHMALRELLAIKINPYSDFKSLQFGNTHDKVVMAVHSGQIDAGTVRSGILESMALNQQIDLFDFKIIAAEETPVFPLLNSTRLYPEWPFSKVRHTSTELAQQVAVALLNMPHTHQAAQAGNYYGWTVPLEYQPVHDLFRELNLPPYSEFKDFTVFDVINKYWHWILLAVITIFTMILISMWAWKLNRELQKTKSCLEYQHELILGSIADGVCGVDLDGNTTFMNRAMEQITGWSSEDLIGKPQHDLIHHTKADGSVHSSSECPIYTTFCDGSPRFVANDLFWKKDGKPISVEYTSNPLHDDKGELGGAVVVFRDITERKELEEQLYSYKNNLAHMARLSTMGEMASGIAHELNQPLTAIITTADASLRMLESNSMSNEKTTETIEKIGNQAHRAAEVIKHIRKFVRREKPELSLVDINSRIKGAMDLLERDIKQQDVKLQLNLSDKIGFEQGKLVKVQPIQIDQVIVNLVQNAIDAMQSLPINERILTITTALGGDNAIITSIADTGTGVAEELQETLFDQFITTKKSGMGMGLSISKSIIELHNGTLYLVDNNSKHKTVFRFVLPIGGE